MCIQRRLFCVFSTNATLKTQGLIWGKVGCVYKKINLFAGEMVTCEFQQEVDEGSRKSCTYTCDCGKDYCSSFFVVLIDKTLEICEIFYE